MERLFLLQLPFRLIAGQQLTDGADDAKGRFEQGRLVRKAGSSVSMMAMNCPLLAEVA